MIENAWKNTDIARKADPKKVLNCQSYCYGILLFCILFWDHISFFNETCIFFVFLLLCISFLIKYVIKVNQS